MSTLISNVCSACFPLDALHRYLPVTDLSLFNVSISSPDDSSMKKETVLIFLKKIIYCKICFKWKKNQFIHIQLFFLMDFKQFYKTFVFDSSLPRVVCRRVHVMSNLCLLTYSGVQHILMTGVLKETGTAYHSRASGFTPDF
jgi:hypothetical protein